MEKKEKTPLELVDSIKDHASDLFEVRQISKALLNIAYSASYDTLKVSAVAFARSLAELAGHVTDIYWDACDIQKILEAKLLEETADVDGEPTIDQMEEVTENDLPFC